MNEFHGWIVIIADNNEEFNIIKEISNRIENFSYDNCFMKLKRMYKSMHLVVSGETKRKGIEVKTAIEIFKYISEIIPDSYGLLYTRDEYDERSYEFKVYRMDKGTFEEEMKDPFLSPTIPVIDDEFELY